MTEPERDRRGLRATLVRWRAPLVLVPLLIGLCYAGLVGARLLWDDPEAISSSGSPGPVVTCWDRSEAVAADCPDPTGLAGLRWVFPSFAPDTPRCREVPYDDSPSRPLEYSCRTRIEGTTARINYSERSSLERGLTYFASRYDGVRAEDLESGDRMVYRDPAPRRDGTYEVTVAYNDFPFAVTVSAVNERLRDRVLRDSVRFRAEQLMRVRPPDPES